MLEGNLLEVDGWWGVILAAKPFMPRKNVFFYKNYFMGLVYAGITLISGEDLILAKRNIIGEEEIKQITVSMLVDTGGVYMCINETIKEQLQLPVIEKRKGQMANGETVEYDLVGPIEVKFKNRRCNVDTIVLPGENELLLGAIPIYDMPARVPFIKLLQ